MDPSKIEEILGASPLSTSEHGPQAGNVQSKGKNMETSLDPFNQMFIHKQ